MKIIVRMMAAMALLLSASATATVAQGWYRDGQYCERASSGAIVCRDRYGRETGTRAPRCQRASSGAIVCRDEYGEEQGGPVFYRNGLQCQRASSGATVCRDRYGRVVSQRW